jgi:acyl-CoA thioesterase YciA
MFIKNRRLVKPEDLNPRGTLFGGKLLQWIDEEAAIFAICQLETENVVTKLISEINFVAPAFNGDVVSFGMEVVSLGKTSIVLKCVVFNKKTKKEIVTIDKIVFVSVDDEGKPMLHGITEPKTE